MNQVYWCHFVITQPRNVPMICTTVETLFLLSPVYCMLVQHFVQFWTHSTCLWSAACSLMCCGRFCTAVGGGKLIGNSGKERKKKRNLQLLGVSIKIIGRVIICNENSMNQQNILKGHIHLKWKLIRKWGFYFADIEYRIHFSFIFILCKRPWFRA